MKKITIIFVSILALGTIACQEEEPTLDTIIVPSNLAVSTTVSTDGSGIVAFTAAAENAITYTYKFSDGETIVAPDGKATKRFTVVGLNTYNYSVIAYGAGGVSSSALYTVEVESDFSDFQAVELLTGGDLSDEGEVVATASKTWYLAASEPAHLGVGATLAFLPDQFWFPGFFSTAPFERCGEDNSGNCLCDDELTFTLNGSGNQLTYQLNNNGSTFFNAGHQDIVGGPVGEDACFEFDTSGTSIVSLAPTSVDWSLVPDPAFSPRGTVMNFSNDAFMGYYVSSSSYEILEIRNDFMYVRTFDGNDPNLAWYHKFSTTPVSDQGADNDEELDSVFNTLVWGDEFDVDGAPNTANWGYDLGTGDNGWGNAESQSYTSDASNVIVEDGLLKITAINDGGDYTSARIQSHTKQEFTYGRVEARAKLPTGGGTWPAIWMLGADFETNIWPAAGELDIMEHVGNQQDVIFASTHDPNNFAGNARTGSTTVAGVSEEFHIYEMEWTATEIIFAVDGQVYHTVSNNDSLPFNKDFFFILNVAMGGTFGGDIDANFMQSTMEVDYIRMYQ